MTRILRAVGIALCGLVIGLPTAAPASAAPVIDVPVAAIPANVSPAPEPSPPIAVPPDLEAAQVSFPGSGGLTMHGTVISPATAEPSRRPGLVLVTGAGTGSPRTRHLTEAVEFARRGMSVLIYDKRSVGYSLFHRSYSQLADDALGAVAALRSQPGIDPAKVGLWGLSEGGWVVPIAASRSKDVAFVVLVGANSLPPLRQATWAVKAGLLRAGVRGSLVDRAELNMYRMIDSLGIFPEAHYDPRPTIAAVRQPVLAIWGTQDLLTPPVESPPGFVSALEKGGNRHYTIRFFGNAEHAAFQTRDGGVTQLDELAPGYADLVGSWVGDVTAGSAPVAQTSGPAPVQDSLTIPVHRSAWWESAAVQLAALALFAVAFGAYPLVALVRRVRGRSHAPVTKAARLLSAGGLVVVPSSLVYVMYLLMTGGESAFPGPVVAGRPVIWLALQCLAVACVVATALTALSWHRARFATARGEKVRLGLLLAGGAALIPWALYWGLLFP
ncbi:alpha/beta hydrolase family protein [Nonomuraea sp. 3N208]|uniref:alpha/beta hydrolase family protein n=1 Tax=Nonomuraea sp. 3N208 TaxID=3457421 RepID=UPI003FCE2006